MNQSTRTPLARHLGLPFALCCILATSCFLEQKLDQTAGHGSPFSKATASSTSSTGSSSDSGATSGSGGAGTSSTGSSSSSSTTSTGVGTGGAAGASDDCTSVRSKARTVLETSCSSCHEAPNVMAGFDFVLDPNMLKTRMTNTNQHFVVAGDPDNSRLYQRMHAHEMPPISARVTFPTADDIGVIHDWIASCLDGTSGWDRPDGGSDAGDVDAGMEAGPPPGCGDPGQPCCNANVCHNNGCCVFGQCRGNGQTCTTPPPDLGLSGTCNNGSCQNTAGMTCGNVGQPCCEASSCTASQVSCLANATTCSACGGADQACCKIGSSQVCIDGFTCIGGGVNKTGNCQACGASGQPCCGTGTAAQKTCDMGLTCTPVLGMGTLCQ